MPLWPGGILEFREVGVDDGGGAVPSSSSSSRGGRSPLEEGNSSSTGSDLAGRDPSVSDFPRTLWKPSRKEYRRSLNFCFAVR